jgi:hypothetical protein
MMKTQIRSAISLQTMRRSSVMAAANLWWLVGLAGVGLVAGSFWLKHKAVTPETASLMSPETQTAGTVVGLSAGVREVLQNLNRPVEVRFYGLVQDRHGNEPWLAYAARVSELLQEFERAGAGKLRVTRVTAPGTEAARAAALAEGLEPLRMNRNEPDLLGLVVSQQNEKVVLSRLDPKWEAALEFDLARAIARVAGAGGTSEPQLNPATVNAAATAELLRVLPDLDSLTLEQARQQLRDVALAEYKVAVAELQKELQEAQARLTGKDDAAARQELQQLQFQQAEKLNEIPRRLDAQLTLLPRIKN